MKTHIFLSLGIFDLVKRCPLTAVSQLGRNERRALVRSPFLDPSLRGASSASLDKAAWSFKVLPGDAVVYGSASDDQYPEPPAYRIGAVASSDIHICRFRSFPIATGLGKERGHVLQSSAMYFFRWSTVCAVLAPPSLYTRGSSVMV